MAPIAGQLPMSEKGLGCVKTVTRKKCRKYSSPPRASSSRAQYDSAVMTHNRPVIFYTRDDCGSFHAAKVMNGPPRQFIASPLNLARRTSPRTSRQFRVVLRANVVFRLEKH